MKPSVLLKSAKVDEAAYSGLNIPETEDDIVQVAVRR